MDDLETAVIVALCAAALALWCSWLGKMPAVRDRNADDNGRLW